MIKADANGETEMMVDALRKIARKADSKRNDDEKTQLRKYLYRVLLNSDRSELRVKPQNQWQYEVGVGRSK